MGMGRAMEIIEALASRGLFLERELNRRGLSRNWLPFAQAMSWARPHGFGVWSHCRYHPSRYELVQLRFPRAVFWGPSALWLLGARAHEPEALWIAIGNRARLPRRLDLSTVVVRSRRLEADVVSLRPPGRMLPLRVHARAHAEADLAQADCLRMLARAQRAHFQRPRDAGLPSAARRGAPAVADLRGPG